MVSWVRRMVHQGCIRTLLGQNQNTLHWTKRRGDSRVIFAEGKFHLSELHAVNIWKPKAKWYIVLNASKSKIMRRYFETSSIIKCDKDKGNENVIWFDWKKCFSFGVFQKLKNKNQILRVLIFEGFCNNCEILSMWNGKVKSGRSSLNSSSKIYIQNLETELEPRQTCGMELFVKVVNCLISNMESFAALVNSWKPKAVN